MSAFNLNDEPDQNNKVKHSTSMPNIAVTTAISDSDTKLTQQDQPSANLPVQPPPPAEPSTAKKLESPKEPQQIHPALQPNKKRRVILPAEQIFGNSIPITAILRKCLPIHAYEPLGILQSACEELRFAGQFLDRLKRIEDPADRMCIVAGFIISGYSGMAYRNRKPFNPLLGETFDYISDDGWKYHAEQVSHQPPMSACHADGDGWEWAQTLHGTITPSFDGSTSLRCLLPVRLSLSNGEEYTWNKVTTIIQNARSEAAKRRVKNEGEMVVQCTNGYECRMLFTGDKNIRGEIKNAQTMAYRLVGQWDKGLNRILLPSNEQERLFKAPPAYELSSKYYGFNKFTLGLNELTPEQKPFVPPTDSRLRPDQRFLEHGDSKRAHESKTLLEVAQRQRAHLPHTQMWFSERNDPITQKMLWFSNGKYWTSKQNNFKDANSQKMLPLFYTE
ncbi:unnamed protein product [Bursaphelenchus okinawaensis]|uniref:Oxysterol-binding protein n=1 Tax=Bursaphelenchus okinawaensis TaxID=465554 RepID=A0A811L5R8_9BILA|nr:unnamed protein product [Bursaphelenchus okinawaensis]CAG9118248.1 unnamed protein product [Bursaphelenchus okinawaensis]